MSRRRPVPLLVVLGVVVAVLGTVGTLSKVQNPSSLPNVLVANNAIESTALYCTGLTSPKYGAVGHVTLMNTTDQPRDVSVEITSNTGAKWTGQLKIAGYAVQSISPAQRVAGESFGLTALVSGGGVVGVSSTSALGAEAPCITTGEKLWYGAGFDTLVGSDAALSIYNPTATPAVLNVTTYTATGFSAPAPFQGLSVGPHAQIRLDLGTQIVATANVGVRVNVLRGVVDVVGVQKSGSRVSFNTGATEEITAVQFPRVTTANSAVAQIRISNPGAGTASVKLDVALAPFKVSPLSETIAPYSSGVFTITPNPAIPAAGYASVRLTSSQPVVAALATGSSAGISLVASGLASSNFVVADLYGRGYEAAALTNVSTHSISVVAYFLAGHGRSRIQRKAIIAGGATAGFEGLFGQNLRGITVMLQSSEPSLQVTLTLPTSPAGTILVEALDGR